MKFYVLTRSSYEESLLVLCNIRLDVCDSVGMKS